MLRCAAIGIVCGVMPGLGGATSQWLSYAHAVQSSGGNKERFGKGAIEGVLGPGASNNSTLGGALITTIAFGVPASLYMAILMGAFIMHGVVPGPDMLQPEAKGGHLALTYSFVWITVVSNLITVGMIFLFIRQLVKVTYVRGSLIMPFILVLIYLGAFAEKNMFPDLLLVFVFGTLGWILEKLRFPRPPLILGLVLGGLAEGKLFLSMNIYGLRWLWRPMVLILIALTLFGVLYPAVKSVIARRRRRIASGEVGTDRPPRTRAQVNLWSSLFAFCLVLIMSAALWQSRKFNVRAGLFPWVIGFPLLGLSLVQLGKELTGRGGIRRPREEDDETQIPPRLAARRTAGMFTWIVIYLVAVWLLGFPVGGTLCSFLYLKFMSREKWPITLAMTAGIFLFIYVLFQQLLHVPFPPGYLFEILGWEQ